MIIPALALLCTAVVFVFWAACRMCAIHDDREGIR